MRMDKEEADDDNECDDKEEDESDKEVKVIRKTESAENRGY
jgi:hypothetical protein